MTTTHTDIIHTGIIHTGIIHTETTAPTTILLRLVVAMATFVAGMATALIIDMDPTAARGQMADFIVTDHGKGQLLIVDENLVVVAETGADEPEAPAEVPVRPATPEPTPEPQPVDDTKTDAPTDDEPTRPTVTVGTIVASPVGGDDKSASDTISAGNLCPGSGALPEGATNHSLSAADVDGDGDMDTLHGYVLDGQGYVQVSFTGGGGSSLAVDPGFAPMVAPRPSLGHDIDGDGREEFTARIGGGVGGFTHGLYQVDGCTLRAVTLDGEAIELHARETIGTRSGFACRQHDNVPVLHVWSLVLLDEDDVDIHVGEPVYAGIGNMYELVDGELIVRYTAEVYEIVGDFGPGDGNACPNLLPA